LTLYIIYIKIKIDFIPKSHWNKEEFVIKLFENIDNKKTNEMIFNILTIDIKTCLDSFSVKPGGLLAFAEKLFIQQKLNDGLELKEETKKRPKI